MAKTWLELKQSRKSHICGIRGLRVKDSSNLKENQRPVCISQQNLNHLRKMMSKQMSGFTMGFSTQHRLLLCAEK